MLFTCGVQFLIMEGGCMCVVIKICVATENQINILPKYKIVLLVL